MKFQGMSKTIKLEEVLENDEFQAIFGGKGVLLQPTPENKPKSTVTIIEFVRLILLFLCAVQSNGSRLLLGLQRSQQAVQELFGEELKGLKGNRWTRGGNVSPTSSLGTRLANRMFLLLIGAPTFAKSIKQGQCDLDILHLDVNYSKNGMKCTLKFEVEEHGGGYTCMGPSQRRSFGGGFGLFM